MPKQEMEEKMKCSIKFSVVGKRSPEDAFCFCIHPIALESNIVICWKV